MNIWKDINPNRISPDDFVAFIEIEKGSSAKYELDKETGLLILDRVLYTATYYPANYGFIPLTYCDDSDPLDVFVLCSKSMAKSSLVRCYPIGVITLEDGKKRDDKIIAIPFSDPEYNIYLDIAELPSHIMKELTNFLEIYKTLEGKSVVIKGSGGAEKAKCAIKDAMELFDKTFKK